MTTNTTRAKTRLMIFVCAMLLTINAARAQSNIAPEAPGISPTWTSGNKQGVGASNTLSSKVWFTIGNGTLNEVYYPTLDKANTRGLELIVTDGRTFAEIESRDTDHRVEVVYPDSLVFRQINTSKKGRYRITKTYITDPDRDTVLINIKLDSIKADNFRLYVFYDPAINNSGLHDTGYTRGDALIAADGAVASALVSGIGFTRASSGYLGASDGWTDLKNDFKLDNAYARAVDGNVIQTGELPSSSANAAFTIALGFGSEGATALAAALSSLREGFDALMQRYNKGWRDYLATLKTVDEKYQEQFQMSAMMLKAHEDKTRRGAGVASLTIPWGDAADASEPGVGGYHQVWARDLYQVATAFYAMGDKESADRALDYLFAVQQKKDGSFPQNSWLDGRPSGGGLQMDQVAYPLLLAYQLGRTDSETFQKRVKPAANFIIDHGPATPQERWEEESGYSPSTIAAEIAGLVCAAQIARRNHDDQSAKLWLDAADDWARRIESWTATTNGPFADRYFIRIAQQGTPNAGLKLEINNGGGVYDEREIVDAGFLELVRLGIRGADDPLIKKSLEVIDKKIRVETPNGSCWYRYNHDGYGEKIDGRGYDGAGVGRLWVLLAGERGEYAIASGEDARPYLDAMQRMANEGRMIPEQVWDRPESPAPHLRFAEATGSATPLAWSNAQFIRLAIAIKEGKLSEVPAPVIERYQKNSDDKNLAEKLNTAASPVITGSQVTFVYRGKASDVEMVGEMTDWDRRGLKLKPIAGTNIKRLSMQFPEDARIEYKYVVDGEWLLDTLNPNKKDNGVGGENNYFTMPQYQPSAAARERAGIKRGRIETLELPQRLSNNRRAIRVYLPPGHSDSNERFPTIYFGDGIEYIERARAAVIADNLIAEGKMRPVVMVFTAPIDRMKEYWLNKSYIDFLVNDLVPLVDSKYRTIRLAESRAIAGASLGGLIAAFAASAHPEVFGNVIGQSSAFSVNAGQIISEVSGSERKPIKWYLEVGRYEGLLDSNRRMKETLESKGYRLAYREMSAGHNWTHWMDALADALIFIFPAK